MTILENMSIAENKGKPYNLGRGVNKAKLEEYREMLRPLNLGLEDKMGVQVGSSPEDRDRHWRCSWLP